MFETELSRHAGEILKPVKRSFTSVHVAPYSAARFDPCGLYPLRKQVLVGRRTQVRDDCAVDERIQILSHEHNAPWCRNLPGDRCRMPQPPGLIASVAELEGPIERLTVTQANRPSAAAVGFQSESTVADKIRLRNGNVAGFFRQLRCKRRAGPFSRLDVDDVSLFVFSLVVPVEVVIPDGRPRGNDERRVFVRYADRVRLSGDNLPERNPIIESPDVEHKFSERQIILKSRSEEHTSELQSRLHLVCRLLLEKKKKT